MASLRVAVSSCTGEAGPGPSHCLVMTLPIYLYTHIYVCTYISLWYATHMCCILSLSLSFIQIRSYMCAYISHTYTHTNYTYLDIFIHVCIHITYKFQLCFYVYYILMATVRPFKGLCFVSMWVYCDFDDFDFNALYIHS